MDWANIAEGAAATIVVAGAAWKVAIAPSVRTLNRIADAVEQVPHLTTKVTELAASSTDLLGRVVRLEERREVREVRNAGGRVPADDEERRRYT